MGFVCKISYFINVSFGLQLIPYACYFHGKYVCLTNALYVLLLSDGYLDVFVFLLLSKVALFNHTVEVQYC